ncbi:hypothetical protein [Flavobacterium sp. HNIBRBA15423]|uniref:hypothetical protein n=1 Tax=Flavobacterium sp. HNIBRBA15423 TaxID=3458683 RepID=UPI004043A0AE
MRKFITSNFEIDLSKLKVADILENSWFSNKFFVKFTFPFEMDLTEENDINFGFLSWFNANSHTTIYEGKYVHRDVMEDAILEIDEVTDKISMSFGYGFDEFPNFNKKLSELPLDKFEVVDIYAHAATIIPQTWPAVNYNFPQIHIDKIDNSEDPWLDFEMIINNYKDGAFLINEVGVDDITYNRNIMQPTPYALHILKKGFEDAGKILMGDILEDETIKKLCIYTDTDYWTTYELESYNILKMSADYVEAGSQVIQGTFPGPFSWSAPTINPTVLFYKYFSDIEITTPGKYRIIGTILLVGLRFSTSYFKIKYRDVVLATQQIYMYGSALTVNVNVIFETLSDLSLNNITVEVYGGRREDRIIIDLAINPIRLHDTSGMAIPTIINQNEVDLTRAVPKITFGEFVNRFKNWFNLDLDQRGNEIHMNFIQDEKKRKEPIDLTIFEVKTPLRKFTRGNSYLLKFQDVETKDYTFLPVFHNKDGFVTANYKTDDKTNEITVDALPLPLLFRNGIQTAHAFDTDESKIYAVLYDGLNTDDLNLSKDPYELLIPQVHEKYWKDWLNFRINSQGFQWSFKAHYEDIANLKNKSKVFAYMNNHIVRSITRTEVSEDEFEIDIETEAEL